MNVPHPVWRLRLYLLITIALLCLGAYSVAAAYQPRPGFLVAYTTSRLLLEGEDPARFYDNDWFSQQAQRFEPTVNDINVNPPTLALLALPLAWLPYRTARLLWGTLNLLLLGLFLWGLWREMKWDQTTTAWVILGTALFQPVYANQGQGQLYLLLAVLTLWGWIGYRRQNEALLGAALAGLLLLKLAGLFLWPLLLGQKRWRALLWGGGTSLVIGLLMLPWLTWASWLTHLRFILVSPSAPERAATAYQGFNGLIRHLFSYDPIYSPEPLLLSPMLARWLPVFVLGLMLVVTLWLGAKAKGADGPFMAAVVLGVIASPLALDYHYVLLLLPLMVMGSVSRPRTPFWFPVAFLVSYLLIALPWPYTTPRLAHGWLAFLAYPKLYAGLLLWAICLFPAVKENSRDASPPAASGQQLTAEILTS